MPRDKTASPPRRRVSRRPYRTGEIRASVLPGGLRVVTERMPGSRTFSAGFFVGVGSRHEADRLHGASHFLEHVLFKGTARRSAEQISAAIDAVGGDLNAYTAKEHTSFYGRALDVDADLCLDVLTDMIGSSLIRTADVEAERGVILDEIAMHSDDPTETVQDLLAAELFGPTGLGRPVIGSAASVGALSRRQIVGHWRHRYAPESTVVAAAGSVDHDRIVDVLARLELPTGEPAAAPALRPTETRAGRLVFETRPTEQCSVALAVPAPSVFEDRRFAVGLLSAIIGGGMSSRLFVEVRERRGLTYGIDAGETSYSDSGIWSVEWQSSPDRLLEIAEVVRAILGDVAEHGVAAEELERAKGQLRGQTVLGFESPSARMGRLGTSTLLGEERTLPEMLACYERVSGDELQREAAELFAQVPVIAVVGPRVPRRQLEKLLQHW